MVFVVAMCQRMRSNVTTFTHFSPPRKVCREGLVNRCGGEKGVKIW